MEPVQYLRSIGGIARTGQLLRAGSSRIDLLALASAGALQPQRGVFALPDCDPAFLMAAKHRARVSCASAARHYGLWLRTPPPSTHLSCNHGHGFGFVRHRTARFSPHAALPLPAVEDVALHALACLPVPASTALATSAVRLHGVPIALLESQLLADRSGSALRALQLVDLRTESLVEVEALHLFSQLGLEVELQVQLDGIGRVDFLLEGFLIVEIDALAFHSSREAKRRDTSRNNASTLSGYPVLRYMPEHIWSEPDRVVAEIMAVIHGRIIR
ncbi:DUF559 domain-containing protein [Micrococcaceae bacterium Sec5.7]